MAKWLSVRLRSKWFWVRVQLQSLENSSKGNPNTKRGTRIGSDLKSKRTALLRGLGFTASSLSKKYSKFLIEQPYKGTMNYDQPVGYIF